LVLLGIAAFFWMVRKAAEGREEARKVAKRRTAADKAEKEKLRQRLDHEKNVRCQVVNNIKSAINAAKQTMCEIPVCLSASEQSTLRAAANFETRSFYPFWDCMAEAVSHLSNYKANIERLDYHGTQYAQQTKHYRTLPGAKDEDVPRPFPASRASLPALRNGAATAERINALYSHAHRDFEFSNIYANWKTNQTLVKGFENMAHGLDVIRDELQHIDLTLNSGFDKVSTSVEVGAAAVMGAIDNQSDALTKSIEAQSAVVTDGMGRLAEQSAAARREQSASETEMIDLLDNIQRKRERLPGIQDTLKEFGTKPVR
jgi:hypothetical protein